MSDFVTLDGDVSASFRIDSTKPGAYFGNAVATATVSSNITLGVAGLYEIAVWQSAGTASYPNFVSLTNTGGTSPMWYIPISGTSSTVRRFYTSESNLIIRLRNFGATEITGAIMAVQ